jgi:hypothetical protein
VGRASAASLLAMAAAVWGCTALWGIDELDYGVAGNGGATSSAHGGTAGGGTAGSGNGEQCLDRVDNDGDGLADCGDATDCAADYQCEVVLPDAERVLLVDPSSACPAGTEPSLVHACTGCECLLSTSPCNVSLNAFSAAGCSGNSNGYTSSGACQTGPGDARWMTLTSALPSPPPSCSVSDPDAPAVQWKACTLTQPGLCPDGQACVPRGSGQVGQVGPCARVGDADVCPPELPNALAVYADSGLQCECACTAGSPLCGASSVTVWHDSASCTGGSTTQILDGAGCQSAGTAGSMLFNVAPAIMTCSASAVDVPAGPWSKLCCPG